MGKGAYRCWEVGSDPEDGRQIAATSGVEAAELYVSADYEGEPDGDRQIWVRPVDGGGDIRVVVRVCSETTFTGLLCTSGGCGREES